MYFTWQLENDGAVFCVQMATCSVDGTARVWDCATGEQLYEFVGEPNECACSVAYRPQVNDTAVRTDQT